jgi:hypothetical protein
MPSTVIENYEPPDEGWSVSLGRLRPKPEPKPEVSDETAQQSVSEDA